MQEHYRKILRKVKNDSSTSTTSKETLKSSETNEDCSDHENEPCGSLKVDEPSAIEKTDLLKTQPLNSDEGNGKDSGVLPGNHI